VKSVVLLKKPAQQIGGSRTNANVFLLVAKSPDAVSTSFGINKIAPVSARESEGVDVLSSGIQGYVGVFSDLNALLSNTSVLLANGTQLTASAYLAALIRVNVPQLSS
jgi:1-deoxy-D-xylulose 5-phosphate reductoisomerase